jgi:integrase
MLLRRQTGQPVHEVVLFIGTKYRTRGRSAETIHQAVRSLALLHSELDAAKIDLQERLKEGRFLTVIEVHRIAAAAQYRLDDDEAGVEGGATGSNVVNVERLRLRHKSKRERRTVDVATVANRIRHFGAFLTFLVEYAVAELPAHQAEKLEVDSARVLKALKAQVPAVSKRAKLDARMGLTEEVERRLLEVVRPDSPENPWKSKFVAKRNWLVIVLLLATGMRRGEMLGLQIGDLHQTQPKLRIIRRADSGTDPRVHQPNTKTYDGEIELSLPLMKVLWNFINNDRRAIKAARKFPQVFVADDGNPLSLDSIDKLFATLRRACPGLPRDLTSHVLRHTWNDRFSEQAEAMGLSPEIEKKARANQQRWSEQSDMADTYTKRYNERKGREVALRLQQKLEEKTNGGK